MRNTAWVGASQLAKVVVAVLSLSVLSRLIPADQFGLFAIVTAILGVADLFRDFGLSLSAIQAPELSAEEQDNLFWANMLIGLLLTALMAAVSVPIAILYGNAALSGLIALASITFVLNGAATQYRVRLIRADRFRVQALVDIVASVLSLAVAIVSGIFGAGSYALALQAVSLAVLGLLLLCATTDWLPRPLHRVVSIRRFVSFGVQLFSVQVVSYLASNLDKIAIGKVYGATAVGYYSKAYTLYLQPLSQVLAPFTNLVLRRLSVLRDDPERFVAELLRVQLLSGLVGFSAFAFAFVTAPDLVRVLLGPGWDPSIVIFQILCLGGAFQMLGFVYYWLFLASGGTKVYLRCALISQPIAAALVLVALPFGTEAVAWGVSVGNITEWLVPALWGAPRLLERAHRLVTGAVRPALVAVAVGVAAFLPTLIAPEAGPSVRIIGAFVAAGVVGVGAAMALPPVRGLVLAAVSARRKHT